MTDQQLLEKIGEIVESKVDQRMAFHLEPVKQQLQLQSSDIHTLKTDIKSIKGTVEEHTIDIMVMKNTLQEHTIDIRKIKRKLNKTSKDINVAIEQFDKRIVHKFS